jgi:hypothetical protein
MPVKNRGGGAKRHRKILPESEALKHQEPDPGAEPAKSLKRANSDLDVEAELIDYSDEDMGFGLFDGDSPPRSPVDTSLVTASHVAKKQKSQTSSDNEDVAGGRVLKNVGPLGDDEPEQQKNKIDNGTLLQRLIKRQSFEGSWSNDTLPCDAMGIKRHTASVIIEKLVAAHPELDRVDVGKAVATALAITFLETKMADQEETWELVVEKAREWLDGAVESGLLEELWKEAKTLVAKG